MSQLSIPNNGSHTAMLAEYAASFRYEDVPRPVVEQTKLVILDTLGVMLAASLRKHPAAQMIATFAQNEGGNPEATIVGFNFKTSSTNAALANGTLAYLCDIETLHLEGILHAAAVLVPVALALGERHKADGQAMIASIVLGFDVAARISFALGPNRQFSRNFHPSAICGTFGAAAAAGHILGLDANQFATAFGLAAGQASGLMAWEMDATEHSRPLQMGVAAKSGITAALLAQLGYGGPTTVLNPGPYSIYQAFSGQAEISRLTHDIGHTFEIMNVAFKRHACCMFLQNGIDALLAILNEQPVEPTDMARITLRFPASGAPIIDNNALKSHNAQYILSVAALRKAVVIDDILDSASPDPSITELSQRVNVVADAELDSWFPRQYPSIVEVQTTSGESFSQRVDAARGFPENRMSQAEVEDKFAQLNAGLIPDEQTTHLVDAVRGLEDLNNIGDLTSLLQKE